MLNFAEAAGQMGKMVEHPNLSEPNPGPRPDESSCTERMEIDVKLIPVSIFTYVAIDGSILFWI